MSKRDRRQQPQTARRKVGVTPASAVSSLILAESESEASDAPIRFLHLQFAAYPAPQSLLDELGRMIEVIEGERNAFDNQLEDLRRAQKVIRAHIKMAQQTTQGIHRMGSLREPTIADSVADILMEHRTEIDGLHIDVIQAKLAQLTPPVIVGRKNLLNTINRWLKRGARSRFKRTKPNTFALAPAFVDQFAGPQNPGQPNGIKTTKPKRNGHALALSSAPAPAAAPAEKAVS